MADKRPMGYWKDWYNVEPKIKKLIDKLGHFPARSEMSCSLDSAIQKYHGGMTELRKRLGYEKNDWSDLKDVKKELKNLEKMLGKFPSSVDIRNSGISGLLSSIHRIHGGYIMVCNLMGKKSKIRPMGYWNRESIKKDLKKVIEQFGYFPTIEELKEKNYTALLGAIAKNGGIIKYQEGMGYKPSKLPNGYWKKWKNVKKELNVLIKQLGHFPTPKEITKNKSSLLSGLEEFGGINAVRERLGYSIEKRTGGFWKDPQNVLSEAKRFLDEHPEYEVLPSKDILGRFGYNSLSVYVIKHFSGFKVFREKLREYMGSPNEEKRLESMLEIYAGDLK